MDDLRDQGVLDAYRREIERLQEENRHLREASQTFGELAERLRARLDMARSHPPGASPRGDRPPRH